MATLVAMLVGAYVAEMRKRDEGRRKVGLVDPPTANAVCGLTVDAEFASRVFSRSLLAF
jgi:hypothetical protein